MKFEIVKDNMVAMWTEYECCIPKSDILTDLYRAGYRFKLNGKSISMKALKEAINNMPTDNN